jgi:hypothetical protein
MKCPTCGARSDAKDTRDIGGKIERRRCCANGHKIITEESFVRVPNSPKEVAKIAATEAVKKERPAPRRDAVREAIRAAGSTGIRAFELVRALKCDKAPSIARKLKADGLVVTIMEGPKLARYFIDKAAASKWVRPKDVERADERRRIQKSRANGVDAPVKTSAHRPTGEAILPSTVKVTKCAPWTHDVRYQMPPGTTVKGEFSSRRIGEYIE